MLAIGCSDFGNDFGKPKKWETSPYLSNIKFSGVIFEQKFDSKSSWVDEKIITKN